MKRFKVENKIYHFFLKKQKKIWGSEEIVNFSTHTLFPDKEKGTENRK